MKCARFAIFITFCILYVACATASGEVAFSYQGRVKIQGQPFNGTGQFKFAILSTSGTETLWSHDGTSSNGSEPTGHIAIPVIDGVFNILIGDTSAGMGAISPTIFASKTPTNLRVWFSDGVHGFEQLSPDRTLVNLALTTLTTGEEDFSLFVNASAGSDENNGLTAESPKKTIQAAINSLPDRLRCNVTISVASGEYRESVTIAGITAMPKKKLKIVGDSSWTPDVEGEPAVVLSGFSAQNGNTPELTHGIYAVGCSNLEIQGFKVTGYLEDGVLTENGTYSLFNCLFNSCGEQGYHGSKNCYVELVNCVADDNNVRGFCLSDLSKATLTSCSATSNGQVGLGLYKECAAELYDGGRFDSNGQKQIELGGCKIAAYDNVHITSNLPTPTCGIFNSYESVTFSYEKYQFTGNLSPKFQNYIGGTAYYVNGATAP